ncbi:MAG: hypothetical protein V1777_00600 [Candidatus Micrarchaeota archaeon]
MARVNVAGMQASKKPKDWKFLAILIVIILLYALSKVLPLLKTVGK